MIVTLQHEKALTPITILTTYAPHKGYPAQDRKQHWGQVEQTIQQIPKSHMAIWCTGSNGQLGENTQEKGTNIVGPYTYSKETEKGNGQRLYNACKTHNLIPMNTWIRPQLTTQEKTQLKKCTNLEVYKQELKNIQNKKQ